jgi:hypothetical protein
MKMIYPFVFLLTVTMVGNGCADKKAAEEKARQDAEAKARADAAKKEMQTLPQAFRPNYYGKRLEPEKSPVTTAPASSTSEQPKKP